MDNFINHTLLLLEDAGMSFSYPQVAQVKVNADGTSHSHRVIHVMSGRRVSIEKNPSLKFLIMFSLLDFHIDKLHPDLEGNSFKRKYELLDRDTDSALILREIFRIAKIIRNALIHNPSSISLNNTGMNVSYTFRNTAFSINISPNGLKSFYTAIAMYSKGNLGNGEYFQGIIRTVYSQIISNITLFSDEFDMALEEVPSGIKINPYVSRDIVILPKFQFNNSIIKISPYEIGDYNSADFYIKHKDIELLIPIEALDQDFSIKEEEVLTCWRREGCFPPINKEL